VRLLVYDRTCVIRGRALSTPWAIGARLYRGLRRIDAARGVASWAEALAWLATHGRWGRAMVGDDVLDAGVLDTSHGLHAALREVRARLAPDALLWFRTCETFGAARGLAFAEALADFLGARVAGHTHVIGVHQSGLHGLAPGARAGWSPDEGLAEGTPADPKRAQPSRRRAPNTITCFDGAVPAEWFSR
jgi:hypothetical protein